MSTHLTYSEVIYLFANKSISDRSRITNYDRHPSDEKVSAKPLSHKMVIAALAYLVQQGYVTLEIKDVKKFFIFPSKEVFGKKVKDAGVEVTGIEKVLLDNFKYETEVHKAVYYLLNADESSPWGQIITISKNSLVQKELLYIEAERKNIFTAKRYLFVENKIVEFFPQLEEVERKLEEFSSNKNMFKMIENNVKTSIAARKEQSSSDD